MKSKHQYFTLFLSVFLISCISTPEYIKPSSNSTKYSSINLLENISMLFVDIADITSKEIIYHDAVKYFQENKIPCFTEFELFSPYSQYSSEETKKTLADQQIAYLIKPEVTVGSVETFLGQFYVPFRATVTVYGGAGSKSLYFVEIYGKKRYYDTGFKKFRFFPEIYQYVLDEFFKEYYIDG